MHSTPSPLRSRVIGATGFLREEANGNVGEGDGGSAERWARAGNIFKLGNTWHMDYVGHPALWVVARGKS